MGSPWMPSEMILSQQPAQNACRAADAQDQEPPLNCLKLGSHTSHFLHKESQQEMNTLGLCSWGAEGGPERPASVRTDQGPAAPGEALLRDQGRGVSSPGSTVSMVSAPAALGTSDAPLCTGEHWEGTMCHTPPYPSQHCQEPRASTPRSLAHPRPRLCGTKATPGLAGAGCQLHLLLAAESSSIPAERSLLSRPRKTEPGDLTGIPGSCHWPSIASLPHRTPTHRVGVTPLGLHRPRTQTTSHKVEHCLRLHSPEGTASGGSAVQWPPVLSGEGRT